MIGDAVFHKQRHVSGHVIAQLSANAVTVQWVGALHAVHHLNELVILKEREEPSRRRHHKNPSRRDLYIAIEFLALQGHPPNMPEIEAELTVRGFTANNYFTLYSGIKTLVDTWWIYRTKVDGVGAYRHHPIHNHL